MTLTVFYCLEDLINNINDMVFLQRSFLLLINGFDEGFKPSLQYSSICLQWIQFPPRHLTMEQTRGEDYLE